MVRKFKEIIWDFDGVILLSDAVREYGFRKIFENESPIAVEKLIAFHLANGGLSRYVKIRYFFEHVLSKPITDAGVNNLALKFSTIMREALTNKVLLNAEWLSLMDNIGKEYTHSIASGSDGEELKYLCDHLNIAHHFKYIYGSPTPKTKLVKQIVFDSIHHPNEFVLVGDAMNDWEAAKANNIAFVGYQKRSLQDAPFFIQDLNLLIDIIK